MVIAPITEDRRLVLIRQYRIPLAAAVLELPAGLCGDSPGAAGEDLIEAARRELLEETGYEASRWRWLLDGPSSAGLTDESYHLYLATGCRKVGPGGGDAQEKIEVLTAPLDGIDAMAGGQATRGHCDRSEDLHWAVFLGASPPLPPGEGRGEGTPPFARHHLSRSSRAIILGCGELGDVLKS